MPQLFRGDGLHLAAVLQNLHADFGEIGHRQGEAQAAARLGLHNLIAMPEFVFDDPRHGRGEVEHHGRQPVSLENAEGPGDILVHRKAGSANPLLLNLQLKNPAELEAARGLTLPAEADQAPGSHVVVQAVGLDLAAGDRTAAARAVGNSDDSSPQQGLGQGVENGP